MEFLLEEICPSSRRRANYEQIKAYVLKRTGLKAISLYISWDKRKRRLDVKQNYNLSKKKDIKVS